MLPNRERTKVRWARLQVCGADRGRVFRIILKSLNYSRVLYFNERTLRYAARVVAFEHEFTRFADATITAIHHGMYIGLWKQRSHVFRVQKKEFVKVGRQLAGRSSPMVKYRDPTCPCDTKENMKEQHECWREKEACG